MSVHKTRYTSGRGYGDMRAGGIITPEVLAKSGSEHGEQCAVFCWAQMNLHRFPELKWLHAIPNGGHRSKPTAALLKAEGVKSGVPDIFLPYPRTVTVQLTNADGSDRGTPFFETYHGLYIEMKRAKGVKSDISPQQVEFANWCELNKYGWVCAFGWDRAVTAIESYLTQNILRRVDA